MIEARRSLLATLGAAALVLEACAAPAPPVSATATTSPSAAVAAPLSGTLAITPTHGLARSRVEVSGSTFPAGKTVTFTWVTVNGSYELTDAIKFAGRKYTEATWQIGSSATAAADGTIATSFTIPEDFGGVHDIIAIVDGRPYAKGGFQVDQRFSMTPESGPVGTPIEILLDGVGWRQWESTWQVVYDNHLTGYLSAVTTRGSARATIRASGPVGPHTVDILRGNMGTPYLNPQQSPFPDVPWANFTFNVTEDKPVASMLVDPLPAPGRSQPGHGVLPSSEGVAILPSRGAVGTPAVVSGRGYKPNLAVELRWQTMVGNRVSGSGFSPKVVPLAKVTTSAQGTFEQKLAIPDDLGGAHTVLAVVDGEERGKAGFLIVPSPYSISPSRAQAGAVITVRVKGVGWTEHDNTYAVIYDNAYLGYACGFNSQGDVTFSLRATGAPGTHLIEFIPTIYTGPNEMPLSYRMPQLTYRQDHPGSDLPAIRFAFEITAP